MSDAKDNTPHEKRIWSDDELRIALDAYLYLLTLDQRGVNLTPTELSALLASIPLPNRNDSSRRYRFRNISYVLSKLDMPYLQAFSPAEKLGTKVEARLIEIIEAYQTTDHILQLEPAAVSTEAGGSKDISDILHKLEALDKRLSEVESEWPARIGHNNPPESIETEILSRRNIEDARSYTETLKQEIGNTKPSTPNVKTGKNYLLTFGLKLSIWLGARVTKFTDAALATLAPILVAKLTNVLPALLDVLRALSKLIGQ